MKELIFNLFLFIEDGNIYELGAVVHDRDGTDADKLSFLQAQVSNDLEKAKRFSLPSRYEMTVQSKNSRIAGMRYEMFKILKSMGRHIEVFEEVFQVFNGPSDPLVCITPIVDDKPRIDKEDYSNIHNLETTRDIQQITEFAMSDYLTEYLTKDGLDLPKLFNWNLDNVN